MNQSSLQDCAQEADTMSKRNKITCVSCRVYFTENQTQRAHYKTDWHRYNLKRKVAELPPVTENEFHAKVEHQTRKKNNSLSENTLFCNACRKSFSSDKSFENHVKSKKHQDLVLQLQQAQKGGQIAELVRKNVTIKPKVGYIPPVNDHVNNESDDDSDNWEDVDEEVTTDDEQSDDEISEALPPNFCLFCPHESVNIDNNLRHMSKSHSFFLPDVEYVTDIEAFLIYLGAKVGDGRICLRCNARSKQFQTLRACQSHMLDKRHCSLDYEGDAMLEYADFYDFSESYPDHEPGQDIDSELSMSDNSLNVDPDTLELVLPSGARAGHRALNKYYKQNLTQSENHRNSSRAMITNVQSHYRSLGLQETSMSIVMKRKIEARRSERKSNNRTFLHMGLKNNKLLRVYMRDSNEGGG